MINILSDLHLIKVHKGRIVGVQSHYLQRTITLDIMLFLLLIALLTPGRISGV